MKGPLLPIFADGKARIFTFDARGPDPLGVSFADLLEWIAAKDPQAIGHWRELSAEEYTRSFAVANTAGYGVLRDIYDGMNRAFANGQTAAEFSNDLLPLMMRKGWIASPAAGARRLELIYDTNLRLSRAKGRWQRYQRTASAFPYLRGVTARDERVRHPPRSESDHRAFDGIILPVAHPFWRRWFVPLGFRCRCSIIQMTRSQLARYPGGVTSADELVEREERLGEPVFTSPASFDAQLEELVIAGNEAKVPGLPGIDMSQMRPRGFDLMQAKLISDGLEELADTLNRIFGIAA